MKSFYKVLAYLLISFIILFFCVPTLLSMPDTIAVVMGIGMIAAWFLVSVHIVRKVLKTTNK